MISVSCKIMLDAATVVTRTATLGASGTPTQMSLEGAATSGSPGSATMSCATSPGGVPLAAQSMVLQALQVNSIT